MKMDITFEEYFEEQSKRYSDEIPTWGFHDASIIYAEELEFAYDYTKPNPIRNCLNIYMDCRGCQSGNTDVISFYNYQIKSGGIPPAGSWWKQEYYDEILENKKYLIGIVCFNCTTEIIYQDESSHLFKGERPGDRDLVGIPPIEPPAIKFDTNDLPEWAGYTGMEIINTKEIEYIHDENDRNALRGCLEICLNENGSEKILSFYNYGVRYGTLPPMHSIWRADQFELFRKKSKRGEKYHLDLDFTLPNGKKHYLDILFEHFEIEEK